MITTVREFEDKYEKYIDEGFEAFEFTPSPPTLCFLDQLFEELVILDPNFKFSKIEHRYSGRPYRMQISVGLMLKSMIEDMIEFHENEYKKILESTK